MDDDEAAVFDFYYELGREDALKWQPADTAPFEKPLLTWHPKHGLRLMLRDDKNDVFDHIVWYAALDDRQRYVSTHDAPTHWMPLPEPPQD